MPVISSAAMLLLFRKLRSKSLAENRFGRYLRYATGEILLVVLGILIALQINNWNEARKNQNRALIHLEQVQSDLKANIDELVWAATGHFELAQELAFAIGVLKRGEIQTDEVERFKWAVLRMKQYPPVSLNTGGYDTMVASGDLAVISDQALKSNIVSIHSFYSQVDQRVQSITSGPGSDFPFSDAARALPHPSGQGLIFEVDYEWLRDNRRTLMDLSMERRNHTMVGEALQQAADESSSTSERIEEILQGS
jgi:hypothetical protein